MNIEKQILYNDDYCVAIYKPLAIPSQSDTTGDTSLLQYAEVYFKQSLYIINRLDRVAQGIVLFAKTPEIASLLSEQFQSKEIKKIYLAVVEKAPPQSEGHLTHFLKKNVSSNTSKAFVSEVKGSKKSDLYYTLISQSDKYFLLKIQLFSGRHHQIRAQLGQIGSPVKGDVKYGARRSNPNRAIHLLAWQLEFKQPKTRNIIHVEAPIPDDDVLWAYFKKQLRL